MEPLVIFGAGLVVWCGYLSILDSVRAWKLHRAARQEPAGHRAPMPGGERRSRPMAGMAAGRPLLHRI